MKVTKNMVHHDLQPYFNKWRLINLLPISLVAWLQNCMAKKIEGKKEEGLICEEKFIPSSDGGKIRIRLYKPLNCKNELPLMLYCHGGGFIMGNPEGQVEVIRNFIESRPCVVIAPDYRKAPENPFPAAFNDCYESLLWANRNAAKLGIFPDKVIVAGHSAGGNLAAAISLKARDTRDFDVAFQIPVYPMIDDLQPKDPARRIKTLVWDTDMNQYGWNAYLRDIQAKREMVSSYAAPARCTDYKGLPPTITLVGTLDPFYQETLAYVNSLRGENIEVTFEIFEGCYHAFENLSPEASISRIAREFTYKSYSDFYDRYIYTNDLCG